ENAHSVSPLSAEDVLDVVDNGRSEGGLVGRHRVLDPIHGTKRVSVNPTGNPEEASFFESYEAAHSSHDYLSSSIANKLGVRALLVMIGSQEKYDALSRGDGAIYFRFPHAGYREKVWDLAAGYIFVIGKKDIPCPWLICILFFSPHVLDFRLILWCMRLAVVEAGGIVSDEKATRANAIPSEDSIYVKAIQDSIDEKAASL
ncbi:hypothetical protein SOVF_191630, partial [Spinacia oleracea]